MARLPSCCEQSAPAPQGRKFPLLMNGTFTDARACEPMNKKKVTTALGFASLMAFVQTAYNFYMAYIANRMLYLLGKLGGPNTQPGAATAEQLRAAFRRYIDDAGTSVFILACLFYALWHLRKEGKRMGEPTPLNR